MKKSKLTLGNKIVYAILTVLIILLFIPTTRTLFQQGLMKIGLFKPDLTKPVTVKSPEVVPAKENATFSDEQGNVLNTADLKGKVVFLNFWATWCPPCRAEMPSIQILYNKFKDHPNIAFLLVEIDHENEKAAAFMQKEKLDMPVYFPEGNIPRNWLGTSIPSTVILDKQGNLAGKHEGMGDYSTQEVEDFISDLINQ